MGIFSKKSAALITENEKLAEQNSRLKNKVVALQNELNNQRELAKKPSNDSELFKLKNENEQLLKELNAKTALVLELEDKLLALTAELEKLEDELFAAQEKAENLSRNEEEIKAREKKSAAKVLDAEAKAEQLKSEALYKYLLELKRLESFIAKWKDFFADDYDFKKREIIDLLAGILGDLKTVAFEELSKKVDNINSLFAKNVDPKSKIIEYLDEKGESEFNLEEVLNPGELDLEQLCKELGVFRG